MSDFYGELLIDLNYSDPYATVRLLGVGAFNISNKFRLSGKAGSEVCIVQQDKGHGFNGLTLFMVGTMKPAVTEIVSEEC